MTRTIRWFFACVSLAACTASGADDYSLAVPGAPTLRNTTDTSSNGNAWLAANNCYAVSALVAPVENRSVAATSVVDRVQGEFVMLTACEGGFAVERTKPEYWLADRIESPDGVDWDATWARYEASNPNKDSFLFDRKAPALYATAGGQAVFEWVLADGTVSKMNYTIGMACQGRPRRIFWTDYPYNAPGVDLSGKFVRFFGDQTILTLKYGASTNFSGGVTSVMTNKVTEGLYVDPSSMILYAAGRLSGQVIMAYYDSGSYETLTAVQVVEVLEPKVNVCSGTIGQKLEPLGDGYNTEGLEPFPTYVDETDGRGPYLYQHTGNYSYSPKHGNVYPIRPTMDCRWNAEVYWKEADVMGVQWPFELDHYQCDWPADTQIFVRGTIAGDYGRPIYFPSEYTVELQKYQEPEGHAKNPGADGTFETTGEGYSLLKLTADDNIWFLPIHSVNRDNGRYFTLKSAELAVGNEARPRLGSSSGTTDDFTSEVDTSVEGYLYAANSGTHYNPNFYHAPTADIGGSDLTDVLSGDESQWGDLPSAVFPVNVPAEATENKLEVWWCSTFKEDDMPVAVTVPTLPQCYTTVWPDETKSPVIALASQLGSANDYLCWRGSSLEVTAEDSHIVLPSRSCFGQNAGTVMFWTKAGAYGNGRMVTFGDDGTNNLLSISTTFSSIGVTAGDVLFTVPFPNEDPGEWTHVALTWSSTNMALVVDGEVLMRKTIAAEQTSVLSAALKGNAIGASSQFPAQTGRQFCEFSTWRRTFTADELKKERYRHWTGKETGLTFYLTVETDEDLISGGDNGDFVVDRVYDTEHLAVKFAVVDGGGAMGYDNGVIVSDSTPRIYGENDRNAIGYNPNEEHAVIRAGSGGYVAWAIRCDLNTDDTSRPAVLVEYERNGRACMQYFTVVATNSVYPELAANCTAGLQLPGPHPLDLFDDPWLKETYWTTSENDDTPAGFRDRKGQLWARCAGTLPIFMYYAMQDGFHFPSMAAQPAVGTPIPWLARLHNVKADLLRGAPAQWTWRVAWPANVPEMCIGQTLTTAVDGLPEVWNAKSIAVLYPDPRNDTSTVALSDPTVAQKVDLPFEVLAKLGMKTGGGEKLTLQKGKYYFNGIPPSASDRVYLDPTLGDGGMLVVIGKKEDNAGGVELLHFNLLNRAEREALLALADSTAEAGDLKLWNDAVNALGTTRVTPSTISLLEGNDVESNYEPVDHYALSAIGGTNYVTIIENDADDTKMVNVSDPISMHVFRVVPRYYTGRIVTREDKVNLLSEQLDVVYEESFAGDANRYVFEWKKAAPNSNGTIPSDYENGYTRKFDLADTVGLTRFTIGAQGDTLANMVNTYYVMRYRAKDASSPAWKVMGDRWSEWCAPPALAEGWVQRVLNNITPFTQRMTDLYENAAETSISMIQQAGAPYEGDVALNQDNLTSVGLIQLYQTILNKAETMSLMLGVNDEGANKQLLLAAERLADLYTVLGDEAYSDAMNPTIGFGSNFGEVESGLGIDYGAASSSLFCFDNQVSSLLEEELALLRGRSGANAPSTTLGPYYNRLVWNFTRGITAGEVAYAVNYNITGTKSSSIDYQQAATLYPQGHGDAYGHYLSALMGYYRLLRNPYFSWGVPGMGEMTVADAVVNVDYYDEAKFATAAANVAKVAADVVDRTARKAWKDGAQSVAGGGYEDSNVTNAFGYGEWASRGGYGGLCNWAVANSLLPVRDEADDELSQALEDKGLLLIDRTTVGELADIAAQVKTIQSKIDTLDRGQNPLGFASGTVPFDLTPIGASDGSNTHYEQVRARAGKAVANAQKVLDHAQAYANRLRMIEESAAGYEDNLDALEQDYNNQLITIYGYPYSDDIGPSGTYPQGYDGPDLYHYMWMDYAQYGLDRMVNLNPVTNVVVEVCSGTNNVVFSESVTNVIVDVTGGDVSTTLTFAFSANGLVQKPSGIQGTRRAQGEIQQAYSDFIIAYIRTLQALDDFDGQLNHLNLKVASLVSKVEEAFSSCASTVSGLEGKMALTTFNTWATLTLNNIEWYLDELDAGTETALGSIPSATGVGLTTIFDPRSLVYAVVNSVKEAGAASLRAARTTINQGIAVRDFGVEISDLEGQIDDAKSACQEVADSVNWQLEEEINAMSAAMVSLQNAWDAMIAAQEVYNTVIAKGERLLEARELARQQAVNNITKLKYNDMFFRKVRNEALSRYSTSFDLAQKYVFLAAKAYDYETGLLASDPDAGSGFLGEIIGTRALGSFAADGTPLTGSSFGDGGLADILARMDANWDVLKPRLGINNPQPYATWFSLRRELFRILPGAEGDAAWRTELAKYKVEDLLTLAEYRRYCQPLQCSNGLQAKEPGFVIPFSTTVDFARNFFGNELAAGDSTFDSTYFATKIAAAGVWFDRYNQGGEVLSKTPNVYLIPVGSDCMRAPGLADGSYLCYNVVDQTIPLPYDIGSSHLDSLDWMPLYDGYTAGVDLATRIRRHPSFRAYSGTAPSDANLDCTRLVGRSVWNTKWLLIIPAGSLNADRDGALASFLSGKDTNRDGTIDVPGVSDIRIGFKSYANSGN